MAASVLPSMPLASTPLAPSSLTSVVRLSEVRVALVHPAQSPAAPQISPLDINHEARTVPRRPVADIIYVYTCIYICIYIHIYRHIMTYACARGVSRKSSDNLNKINSFNDVDGDDDDDHDDDDDKGDTSNVVIITLVEYCSFGGGQYFGGSTPRPA